MPAGNRPHAPGAHSSRRGRHANLRRPRLRSPAARAAAARCQRRVAHRPACGHARLYSSRDGKANALVVPAAPGFTVVAAKAANEAEIETNTGNEKQIYVSSVKPVGAGSGEGALLTNGTEAGREFRRAAPVRPESSQSRSA